MILTESSAANVGATAVTAIASEKTGTLQFMCYALTQLQSAQLGSLNLEKNGTGTLQLSGAGLIHAGTIKINNGAFDAANASTLNGVISGDGVLKKSGSENLTLGDTNTYAGGTLSSEGTITFSKNNAFGTGLFTATANSQIITGFNRTLTNNFQINSGTMQYRVNGGLITLIISGDISGNGFLSKTSTGRLNLDGTLTYTGSTNIVSGFLRARKTEGASTATATFSSTTLSVAFDISPPSGTTDFRFFQGTTVQIYAAVTLSGTGIPAGTTATYNSANSTLSVTVP